MSNRELRNQPRRRSRRAIGGVLAVGALGGAVLAPATAGATPGTGQVIVTNYGNSDPRNSTMFLMSVPNGYPVIDDQFRTGSGLGSLDTCAVNAGPAPVGNYRMTAVPFHRDDYQGTQIFGRVWRLENKKCSKGTWRTELFIHTEETPSQGQGSKENRRWDGTSDYSSLGCWKVARANNGGDNGVGRVDSWWHSKAVGGAADTSYSGTVHGVVW